MEELETNECTTEQTNLDLSDYDADWESNLSVHELQSEEETRTYRNMRSQSEYFSSLSRSDSGRSVQGSGSSDLTCSGESGEDANNSLERVGGIKKKKSKEMIAKKDKKVKSEDKKEKKKAKDKIQCPSPRLERSSTTGVIRTRGIQKSGTNAEASISAQQTSEQGEEKGVYQFGRMYHFAFMPNGYVASSSLCLESQLAEKCSQVLRPVDGTGVS